MKEYYECHVTMIGKPEDIQPQVECQGWIFSCINNDICLGEGVKCYATRHYSCSKFTQQEVITRVAAMAFILTVVGINVLREKVELVVYDTKSSSCKVNQE